MQKLVHLLVLEDVEFVFVEILDQLEKDEFFINTFVIDLDGVFSVQPDS